MSERNVLDAAWEHRERLRLDALRADLVAERDAARTECFSLRDQIDTLRAALAEALDGWERWNRSYNDDRDGRDEMDPEVGQRIASLRAKSLGGK